MIRRLKVLHFINDSGRGPYFCAIADFTDRSWFDTVVGSLGPGGPLQEDMKEREIRTLALGFKRRTQYPSAVLRLAVWLRRERVDVIQTHLLDASLVGLSAARLAGTPLAVFTLHHSHEIPLHRKKLLRWADCLCSRHLSHRIIAPSAQMKETLIREEGVSEQKIAIIPHGFDLTRWRPSLRARERIRAELGLNGKITFAAVGRLYWIKNYPSLLSAFALIAASRPDVVLLIVGEGQDRTQLQALAKTLSIEHRVIFTGHRSDIVEVLSAVDVFVHASLAESFGQVLVEACALGKPVVSTKVGIACELIEDHVSGFLVPNAHPTALRDGLEAILKERSRWEEMGREGKRRVQRFSAKKIVPTYEAQYLKWLEEKGRMSGMDSSA